MEVECESQFDDNFCRDESGSKYVVRMPLLTEQPQLGGAHTEAEAKRLKKELTDLLPSAGFEQRKWISNRRELLFDIPLEHLEKPHICDNADSLDYVKILVIQCNASNDQFAYHLNLSLE
ncbi:hypothetical protein EVAR_82809_1 [Eumeta japonica]|uniref:Uncharacterized protein n=1 Tax=Eumeta variegata TaxID=151549 RepID=A0A4C1UNK1_EUMVA|nr:hypothetical protein EVAR_82809_1 [Eumeta japonica]